MSNFLQDPEQHPSEPTGESHPEGARLPGQPAIPGQVVVRRPMGAPVVTFTLIAITVVVFTLQLASETLYQGVDIPARLGMKVNDLILMGQIWRLFTPMFLHGSIMHLAFNMYALYIFGPGLERHSGHGRFLALYLLAGFAGNVMSFLFTTAPSLGSSTAIFGLLGAEGVFLYQNRQLFGRTAQRALWNIAMIALINLVIGLSPGIDNWGHIGGLLGGLLFGYGAGPVLAVKGAYPEFVVSDQREQGDVLRTGFSVGLLFALLAIAGAFIQSR